MPEFLHRQLPQNRVWRYAYALFLSILAALLGYWVHPDLMPPFLLVGTLLTTLLGGAGPGLLTLPLNLAAITILQLPAGIDNWQLLSIPLGKHVLIGLILIALVERLHHLHRKKLARQDADALLAQAGSVLVETLEFETALRQLAQMASAHFSDWCLVTVLEGNEQKPLLVIAGKDARDESWTGALERAYTIDLAGRYGSGKAIVSGQPVLIEHFTDAHLTEMVADPEQLALFKRMRVHSYLSMPLFARDRVIGSLAFGLSATPGHFGPQDVELASELARRAALAIDNARLYRQARGAETALLEKERALQQAYAFREQVLENARHSIFALDLEGRFVLVNQAGAAIAGFTVEELLGEHFKVMFQPEIIPGLLQLFDRITQEGIPVRDMEVPLVRKDGAARLICFSVTPLFEGDRVINVVGTAEDITERRETEKKLAQLAQSDSLTGLPNRALLQDRLAHALAQAQRHGRQAALMFLDLDGFKQVNDRLGHDAGDVLLQTIAERLQNAVRQGDTVARLGGDEFVILLEELPMVAEAQEVAVRILKSIAEPIALLGQSIQTSCSIGIAIYPHDGWESAALLKHADQAMYQAKAQGRNGIQFYAGNQGTYLEDLQMPLPELTD